MIALVMPTILLVMPKTTMMFAIALVASATAPANPAHVMSAPVMSANDHASVNAEDRDPTDIIEIRTVAARKDPHAPTVDTDRVVTIAPIAEIETTTTISPHPTAITITTATLPLITNGQLN